MHTEFWHERWALNEIGFHQAEADPLLVKYWPGLAQPGGQVFVPLCGKSLDMVWLRERGHPVLGVELSQRAVEAFFAEQAMGFSSASHDGFKIHISAGIKLLCGDFFQLRPEHLAGTQAVYDRAALIALPADMQQRYAAHLLELLPQRPPILLVALEYDPAEMAGPPFSTPTPTIESLFGQAYNIELLSERDALADSPALQKRGLSGLLERAYWLTRR